MLPIIPYTSFDMFYIYVKIISVLDLGFKEPVHSSIPYFYIPFFPTTSEAGIFIS